MYELANREACVEAMKKKNALELQVIVQDQMLYYTLVCVYYTTLYVKLNIFNKFTF